MDLVGSAVRGRRVLERSRRPLAACPCRRAIVRRRSLRAGLTFQKRLSWLRGFTRLVLASWFLHVRREQSPADDALDVNDWRLARSGTDRVCVRQKNIVKAEDRVVDRLTVLSSRHSGHSQDGCEVSPRQFAARPEEVLDALLFATSPRRV